MLRRIAARVAGRDSWLYLMEKKAPGETRGFLECSWPAFASRPRRCANLSNSEVLVCGRGGFICRVLHCRPRISGGLLNVAFQLLSGTFRLEFVGADHVTNALLCLARHFIRKAARLVCRATHRDCSHVAELTLSNVPERAGRSTLDWNTASKAVKSASNKAAPSSPRPRLREAAAGAISPLRAGLSCAASPRQSRGSGRPRVERFRGAASHTGGGRAHSAAATGLRCEQPTTGLLP